MRHKYFLGILLSFAMVMELIPVLAAPVYAESYELWVGGKVYSFNIRPYKKVENLSTGKMKKVYGKKSNTKKIKAK